METAAAVHAAALRTASPGLAALGVKPAVGLARSEAWNATLHRPRATALEVTMRRQLPLSALLFALTLVAASASATHVHFSTGDGIEVHGDDVVITPDDGPAAEISPGGELRIDGRRVALDDQQRRMLARYNRKVHTIEKHAIEVGVEGAGIGIEALGTVVAALFTGDASAAERRIQPHADRLKDKARQLCYEVRSLRTLQDVAAGAIPAFRPYALMDDDAPDCHVDD